MQTLRERYSPTITFWQQGCIQHCKCICLQFYWCFTLHVYFFILKSSRKKLGLRILLKESPWVSNIQTTKYTKLTFHKLFTLFLRRLQRYGNRIKHRAYIILHILELHQCNGKATVFKQIAGEQIASCHHYFFLNCTKLKNTVLYLELIL